MSLSSSSGAISFADVRAALGSTDPSATNAGALRAIIGRGSFATIQKHLDAIRAERAPAVPVPGAIPGAPGEAVAAIWGAAWAQAQVLTLGRLELVTVERDAAQELAATRAQDVAGLAAEIDARESAGTAQAGAHAQELAAAQYLAAQATAQAEALRVELAAALAEVERVKAAAAQAAELAALSFNAERLAMQVSLDRQIDKYTELKSVVGRLKPAAR
jgi:hypothetical protein